MKKLFFIALLAITAIAAQAQTQPQLNYGYLSFTHDSVVTGDTLVLKPGLTVAAAADTINALKIKLPTGTQIKSGQVYHVTVTKGVTNVTYLNGTGYALPTAIKVQQNHSLNNSKIVADGSFGLAYDKNKALWYRVE